MKRTLLLAYSTIMMVLGIGCSPEDENDSGWNNLGRNCGNGHHADFSFNSAGGENLAFTPGPDEVTLANYSEGTSVTSTQLAFGWAVTDLEYSVGLTVNQRLEAGTITVGQLSEGTLVLTVDSNGTGIRQYQSSDFTLTVSEAEYETLSFGSERLVHVEGDFTGNFIDVLSGSPDPKAVNGSFCLHGHAD